MYIVIDHKGRVKRKKSADPTWGVSLKGYLKVSYRQLVKNFGKPETNALGVSWDLYTPGGPACIYSWDEDIRPAEHIDIWHVGAHTHEPYRWIIDVLGLGEEEQG